MNPIIFEPWIVMEFNRQHEELIARIQMEKLVKITLRNGKPKTNRVSTTIVRIGREVAVFGTSLKEHYRNHSQNRSVMKQENYDGRCP